MLHVLHTFKIQWNLLFIGHLSYIRGQATLLQTQVQVVNLFPLDRNLTV